MPPKKRLDSLADNLRPYAKRIPKEHIIFQPYRGKPDTMITTHGYEYNLRHAVSLLPTVMPQGLQCVTWLPKSREVGKEIARSVARQTNVSCLPLDVVKSNPFNVMVVAPRLDRAYIAHVLELEDLLAHRKKLLGDKTAKMAGYGKGDFIVWSLVVDRATNKMADLWTIENDHGNVFTTLDSYLLDGSAFS